MRTSCTHCGTHFKVPDKTLGKQARCKSCGKMFVITPVAGEADVDLEEVGQPAARPAVPPPAGRDRRARPDRRSPQPAPREEPDDPLDALADAAAESGSHSQPVHHSPRAGHAPRSRQRDDDPDDRDRGGRHRMAKGAKLSMTLGIAALVVGVLGSVCGVVAMFKKGEQSTFIALALTSGGLLLVTGLLGMLAVVNGSGASKHIRHARHPLAGRSEASTGVITGWIAMGIVLAGIVTGGIWLSNNRDAVKFEKHKIAAPE